MIHAFSTLSLFTLPAPFDRILVVLLYLIIISVAILVWCLFILLLWSLYTKNRQVAYMIEMENRGNVETPLQIKIEMGDLKKHVKPSWWLGSQRLKPKTIQQYSFKEEIIAAPAAKETGKKSPEKKPEDKKPGIKEKADQKFDLFKTMALAVASISSTLGTLLPGPLKGPFKDFADSIMKTQSRASQVMSQPDRLTNSGQQMKTNLKRLKNPAGARPTTKTSAAESRQETGKTSTQATIQTEQKVRHRITQNIQVFETRLLNPAERLIYRLVLRPNNPFPRLSGTFEITSQQLEYDDLPSYQEVLPVSLTGKLDIKPLHLGFVFLFFFASVFVLAANLGIALLAAGWLKGFIPVL